MVVEASVIFGKLPQLVILDKSEFRFQEVHKELLSL